MLFVLITLYFELVLSLRNSALAFCTREAEKVFKKALLNFNKHFELEILL